MITPTRLPGRIILSIQGEDAPEFLERLVTCRVDDMAPDEARYGALLTPQGKIISDFLIKRTSGGFLLDCPEGGAEALEKRFKMFKLRAAIDIERPAHLHALLSENGFEDPRSPALPRRDIGRDCGAEAADLNAYHTACITAGAPEFGVDFEEASVFPADVNMDRMNGVDFKKGCFVGQEVVSRMHRRGKTRKRTLMIKGEGLTPGADVHGEAPIGVVTSTCGSAGLALIRIDRMAKAPAYSVNGAPVEFEKPDWLQGEIDALLGDG